MRYITTDGTDYNNVLNLSLIRHMIDWKQFYVGFPPERQVNVESEIPSEEEMMMGIMPTSTTINDFTVEEHLNGLYYVRDYCLENNLIEDLYKYYENLAEDFSTRYPESELLIRKKLAKIKLDVDRNEDLIKPIIFNGSSFQSDSKSLDAMKEVLDTLTDKAKIKWSDKDNKVVELTKTQLSELRKSILDRNLKINENIVLAKEQVENSNTKEELDKILTEHLNKF